jgi:hypothetical protein
LAVLAYAVKIGPGTARAVHAQLSRLETELVATAWTTPGTRSRLFIGSARRDLAAARE